MSQKDDAERNAGYGEFPPGFVRWRYRTEHDLADRRQAYVDSVLVMVRVICEKHGRAVATIGDTAAGAMFIARHPRRHFPKFRAQRHNPRFLAEFEGMLDLDDQQHVPIDGADAEISEAWCRKGKHSVRLDPAALRTAVADYRGRTGTALTLVV